MILTGSWNFTVPRLLTTLAKHSFRSRLLAFVLTSVDVCIARSAWLGCRLDASLIGVINWLWLLERCLCLEQLATKHHYINITSHLQATIEDIAVSTFTWFATSDSLFFGVTSFLSFFLIIAKHSQKVFTALHGMQTRSYDEISVRLSVCLSVKRVHCDKTEERYV